jgi:hypothetical protein
MCQYFLYIHLKIKILVTHIVSSDFPSLIYPTLLLCFTYIFFTQSAEHIQHCYFVLHVFSLHSQPNTILPGSTVDQHCFLSVSLIPEQSTVAITWPSGSDIYPSLPLVIPSYFYPARIHCIFLTFCSQINLVPPKCIAWPPGILTAAVDR